MARFDSIAVWLSADKHGHITMLHVPKEFDLVLVSDSETDRDVILERLETLATRSGLSLLRHNCASSYIFEKAVTKTRRQQLLTKFFRGVFAEVGNCRETFCDVVMTSQ